MILHKVHLSPYEHQSLTQCLANMSEQDSLILLESAVYALAGKCKETEALSRLNALYVIQNDLEARNIVNSLSNCRAISYNDMVELCVTHKQVLAW